MTSKPRGVQILFKGPSTYVQKNFICNMKREPMKFKGGPKFHKTYILVAVYIYVYILSMDNNNTIFYSGWTQIARRLLEGKELKIGTWSRYQTRLYTWESGTRRYICMYVYICIRRALMIWLYHLDFLTLDIVWCLCIFIYFFFIVIVELYMRL